jgi:Flp pilus assembly protein TadG
MNENYARVNVRRSSRSRNYLQRAGAVSVEFAITAPILFLLVFSSIDFARMNVIRHTADNAAYEGARRGIVPGATASDVSATAQAIMSSVSAHDVTINVSPPVIQPDTPQLTVDVDVPADQNGWIASKFFSGHRFQGRCTLSREEY